jgi:hypothetical protein
MFPINAAEQERYYIMHVLKNPQCISVLQFAQHVEQLNAYITQMPCLYNSPAVNVMTILANLPLTEADLESHIFWICPIQWQDQYNLHKRGMTLLVMCLLLTSLEAIERVCMQEKAYAPTGKKASHKGKKSNKRHGTKPTDGVLKKACTEKRCNLCKKHGGAYTTHNTRDCCKYEKDGEETYGFCTSKKGGKKPDPAKQNCAQLSKKLDKFEKALKKSSCKSKKCCYEDSDSDSE